MPWHICTAQFITQPQKLHDSCMYQVTGVTCSFVHGMGLQPAGINQLVTHIILFFRVRPANQQPTITGVHLCHKNGGHPHLCHKNGGHPWFTETRVIRYQLFVLVHNTRFHSECHTNDKCSNQTRENIIPPMNIQYHKIYARN